MSEGKSILGGILIILAAFLVLIPNPLFITDNNVYNMPISYTDNGTDNLSISFIFDKTLIHQIYDISEGRKVYKNYVNIYIDEFLDNSSTSAVDFVLVNLNTASPVNKSYEYSFQIEPETLNNENQVLNIIKTSGLRVNYIELSYFGANYANVSTYNNIMWFLIIILILVGILLMV